jgi:20S proteasome alpha/beta subunit
MSFLLYPNSSVAGLPNASPSNAPSGFVLGDHAREADVLEAAYNRQGFPRELGPAGHAFQPYVNNGGTVVAVSGKDYSIVASDTRLGLGYAIPARYVSRVIKLTDKVVLASSGMQADIATLHKVLKIRLTQYFHTHQKEMSLEAVSQMLSNILYYRRFQPYYTFNVLGGIDKEGTSCASFLPSNGTSHFQLCLGNYCSP